MTSSVHTVLLSDVRSERLSGTNVLRLEADTVGHFRGQCAEFCGKGHAEMILFIEAHTPESFVAWMEGYKHE